jgi:hypothetical protein|tara:strand:- start:753 stop:953 length:201 start_codon:yes stop_codon:yes gene_type:complete
MMFITEIDIQTIEGKIETHEGPIITAKTLREAKLKAKTMNSDLRIVGEYMQSIKSLDDEGLGFLEF